MAVLIRKSQKYVPPKKLQAAYCWEKKRNKTKNLTRYSARLNFVKKTRVPITVKAFTTSTVEVCIAQDMLISLAITSAKTANTAAIEWK